MKKRQQNEPLASGNIGYLVEKAAVEDHGAPARRAVGAHAVLREAKAAAFVVIAQREGDRKLTVSG